MLEFFQWTYQSENEQLDRLDSRDGLLTGVVTVLAGVGIFYSRVFPLGFDSWWNLAFWPCSILFGLALVAAIFCVCGSIWPKDRAVLSDPEQLSVYLTESVEYYRYIETNPGISRVRAESDFRELVLTQFVQASQFNRDRMTNKAAWQARTLHFVGLAIVIMLLNAVPTFFVQRERAESERKVTVNSVSPLNFELANLVQKEG